ncbi:MAG: VOC family protein [Planctomycetes bacterium]|nr:VOC family protein [Planctomycetota bacterium]
MTKNVQAIPTGLAGPIPHLVAKDASAALAFYVKAFGAQEVCRMPGPDGRLMHAEFTLDGRMVFLADDFPEYCGGKEMNPNALGGTGVTIHRYVADCDAAIERATKAGATVVMPPMDMFWGDRYGLVRDPFGHHWAFATHIKDMTPDEMLAASKACFEQPAAK